MVCLCMIMFLKTFCTNSVTKVITKHEIVFFWYNFCFRTYEYKQISTPKSYQTRVHIDVAERDKYFDLII